MVNKLENFVNLTLVARAADVKLSSVALPNQPGLPGLDAGGGNPGAASWPQGTTYPLIIRKKVPLRTAPLLGLSGGGGIWRTCGVGGADEDVPWLQVQFNKYTPPHGVAAGILKIR